MLPPRHSVTLNPSALSSPVNSRLTPPRRDPHSEWMLMQDTSSLMIVPKLRVLRPLAAGTVLCVRVINDLDHIDRVFSVLSMHRITDPSDRVAGLGHCLNVTREMISDLIHTSSKTIAVVQKRPNEQLTLAAPYRVIRVTRPGSLSGFMTGEW